MKDINDRYFQQEVIPYAVDKWERTIEDLKKEKFPKAWYEPCAICEWFERIDGIRCSCPLLNSSRGCHTEYIALKECLIENDLKNALPHAINFFNAILNLKNNSV